MAETLLPSVRGRTRIAVAAVALAAATTSGALVGLAAGIVAAPLRWMAQSAFTIDHVEMVAALVAVGLALDGVTLTSGRWRPLSLGRQVPREWGRWFGPRVVAVLYGARLGIGPSTMLSTWTWWSVTVAAALVGPGPSALAGAVFGAVRILLTILATTLVVSRPTPAMASLAGPGGVNGPARRQQLQPLSRLGRHKRPGWLAVDAVVAAVVVSAVLTGCAGGDDGSAAPPPSPTPSSSPSSSPSPSPSRVGPDPSVAGGPVPGSSGPGRSERDPADGAIRSLTDPRLLTAGTTPARLEDFVRIPSSNPTGRVLDGGGPERSGLIGATPAGPRAPSAAPEALADSLVTVVGGFEPVGDSGADRFLDLAAAAAIQPDPSAETALLVTRGFEGGWTRAFRSTGNDVVVASVYQFADPAEAEFYLEDGLITIGGYGGRFFDLAALPGVRGFHQQIDDGDEELSVLGAAFHVGPRWYLIYALGSAGTVTPEVLVDVVAAQRRLAQQPA